MYRVPAVPSGARSPAAALLGLTTLAMALIAAPAPAQEAVGLPSDLDPRVWQSYPSAEARMALWPAEARRKNQGGDAAGACHVAKDGALTDCRVIIERPQRQGFGAALLALAAQARHQPGPTPDMIGDEVPIAASWPVPDTPPIWLQHFKPGDATIIYTPAAQHNPTAGTSVVNCMTGAQGDLYDCRVLLESPPGMGYGWMGWRFTPFFKFAPARYQGRGVKAVANIPFHFPPIAQPGSEK